MRFAYEMEYRHPTGEKSSVELIPYSSEYQEAYKQMYNACFYEMRKALDIRPYHYIQNDAFFETGMEEVFLLVKNGELIGSVRLHGNEIDDLIVSPSHQGLGYGRQILLWALEHIRSQRVLLRAAEWNKRAIRLYQETGFEIIRTAKF